MVVKHTQQNDDVIYQLMRFVKNTIIYTQFYLYPIKLCPHQLLTCLYSLRHPFLLMDQQHPYITCVNGQWVSKSAMRWKHSLPHQVQRIQCFLYNLQRCIQSFHFLAEAIQHLHAIPNHPHVFKWNMWAINDRCG